MKMTRLWGGGFIAAVLLWTSIALAAGSAERTTILLTRLYAHHICADMEAKPGIRVANTPAQADALWSLCHGRLVVGGSAQERPPMDVDRERLIYLHMGARRTGGYHLDLAVEHADQVENTLVISVVWQEPSKDAIVTQMLTHPCLLLAVPRGTYEQIDVVDEQGRVRLTESLTPGAP